ncbi:hypothetical protein QN372_12600 [Undibacterium sp. RTI2.1]|uniref:hypothetical protein n=1 Tax=unclassified Undibacterium TaxID=2630295 RepID=UPI002B2360C1|nr:MULTISPECIES: hypothetical protein [unclassified Undibacterium]MEB0031591.1 hypothetical protein [Undibacterium sp. RTI2.1]MEB0117838.1 hypothetical protein [Undibacterium sp. RTI2.2]
MRTIIVLSALTLLSACSKKPEPAISSEPPLFKIAEPQREQLQKAKEVEQTLQKAADAQRQVIDGVSASQVEK